MTSIAGSKFIRVLTLVVIVQGVLFYSASRGEIVPSIAPFSRFPTQVGEWRMAQEGVIDEETQAVLKADDLLTRWYVTPGGGGASLFMAFFKTQRAGQSPHSPKNCLPGSGWQPSESGRVDVPVAGGTIRVNHYVVARGDNESLVMYWYQSHGRVIADEFAAKFYLITDSIREHRSDTALVRVVVPIISGRHEPAEKIATDFVQAFYPVVSGYLPH